MKRLIVAAALLSLAGCKDYGRCLESHVEHHEGYFYPQTILIPGPNGSLSSIMTMQYMPPTDSTVCDRWEFPDGRPAT